MLGDGGCGFLLVMTGTGSLDVEAPKAALASAGTKASDAEARIAASTLMIEKLRRALYRRRSERKASLVDPLLANATEDEFSAERAAPGSTAAVKGFIRRKPARNPFPAHWPRERVVVRLCRRPPPACVVGWTGCPRWARMSLRPQR